MTEKPALKGRKTITGLAETDDQAFAMIAALTSELTVTRERLDTLERLLVASGALAPDAVESYVADEPAAAARDGMRQRIIAKVFAPLREAARRAAGIK